jgi:hypothetical protein
LTEAGVTFDYSTTPTFSVGDGITDIDDINHQSLVTFFGRPNGYTGVNEALIEITRETGTGGNGTGGQFLNTYAVYGGFGVTSGSKYYNIQTSFGQRTEILFFNKRD